MRPPLMTERFRCDHGLQSVYALAFSPDGSRLAAGGVASPLAGSLYADRHHVGLWDPATGVETARFAPCAAAIRSVAFSPDGQMLACGTDGSMHVWAVDTGKEIFGQVSESVICHAVAFHPTERVLATTSPTTQHSATLWDAATWTIRGHLAGHTAPATALAFSPDGALLATGSTDGAVRLWATESGQEKGVLPASRTVHALTFSPDGGELALSDGWGMAHMFDVATGKQRREWFGLVDHTIEALAYSPNGQLLTAALSEEYTHHGAVVLWRVTPGEWRTWMSVVTGAVMYAVAVSPDGSMLASAGDDELQLWAIE